MSYALKLRPSAQKELDRLPATEFARVDAAILGLAANPRPYGVQKLKGHLHRIRIGRWRVIYAIFDDRREAIILRIAKRDERTYKFFT